MNPKSVKQDFLNHYNITDFHANSKSGGQKEVFFPVREGQKQVLKVFPTGFNERLDREMEIYEQFKDSEGVPKILLVDSFKGSDFIFEEYIEGDTLSDIKGNYFEQSVLIAQLLKDIFAIMTPIWKAKYVHRDIKPENIIIRNNGKPVVIDFGIARDLDGTTLTGTGFQPMSWRFASPEQYMGDRHKISHKTDIFSLGALAYYLFHQSLPFGNTLLEISKRFSEKREGFLFHKDFTLQAFCSEALRFNVSERPRLITDLTDLI